jgi:hypothetical protein
VLRSDPLDGRRQAAKPPFPGTTLLLRQRGGTRGGSRRGGPIGRDGVEQDDSSQSRGRFWERCGGRKGRRGAFCQGGFEQDVVGEGGRRRRRGRRRGRGRGRRRRKDGRRTRAIESSKCAEQDVDGEGRRGRRVRRGARWWW